MPYGPLPVSDNLRRSPLHARHEALGATFAPFGGWEMPVQYSGTVAEHTATKTIKSWDRLAMRVVEVRGKIVIGGGLLPLGHELSEKAIATIGTEIPVDDSGSLVVLIEEDVRR